MSALVAPRKLNCPPEAEEELIWAFDGIYVGDIGRWDFRRKVKE